MASDSNAFRWTEAYSVNIDHLDQQHQGLFATVEELNEALRAGRGSEVLDPILTKLVDYTVTHFAAEEALMEEYDFPGASAHRDQHQAFREKISVFLQDYRSGKPGVPVKLMFFLQNWLKEHIRRTDKQYGGFLNARGVH